MIWLLSTSLYQASGSGSWSLVAELLEENNSRGSPKDEEDIIKAAMATSYIGKNESLW